MEVFRISREMYSHSLHASRVANRWNLKGQGVIYCSSARSLSTLELIVHKGSVIPTERYRVMIISIADDDHLVNQIKLQDLPKDWRTSGAYSRLQEIGGAWIRNADSLVLKVPSSVIPYEYNYLINVEHPHFKSKVKLVRTEKYFWDLRLV